MYYKCSDALSMYIAAPPKRTSSTEEEAAATKMQAAMRGTWGRKEASERMQQELTALEVEDQYERLRVQLTEALATQEALIAFHDAERKTWAAERIRLGGEEVQALSASALEAIKEERVAIKVRPETVLSIASTSRSNCRLLSHLIGADANTLALQASTAPNGVGVAGGAVPLNHSRGLC